MLRFAAVAVTVALITTSCAGSALDLSVEEQQQVAQTGWNNTGRMDLTVDDWVTIAERGCERGAWLPEVQRAIAAEWDLDRNVSAEEAAMTVFLVSVQACRGRFPSDSVGG